MSATHHGAFARVRTDTGEVEVVLVGGPLDLPVAHRYGRASRTDTKIKISHRAGYEHFERVDDADAGSSLPLVFTWTTRTRIAE
jgi:uncharacterized protein DUF5988